MQTSVGNPTQQQKAKNILQNYYGRPDYLVSVLNREKVHPDWPDILHDILKCELKKSKDLALLKGVFSYTMRSDPIAGQAINLFHHLSTDDDFISIPIEMWLALLEIEDAKTPNTRPLLKAMIHHIEQAKIQAKKYAHQILSVFFRTRPNFVLPAEMGITPFINILDQEEKSDAKLTLFDKVTVAAVEENSLDAWTILLAYFNRSRLINAQTKAIVWWLLAKESERVSADSNTLLYQMMRHAVQDNKVAQTILVEHFKTCNLETSATDYFSLALEGISIADWTVFLAKETQMHRTKPDLLMRLIFITVHGTSEKSKAQAVNILNKYFNTDDYVEAAIEHISVKNWRDIFDMKPKTPENNQELLLPLLKRATTANNKSMQILRHFNDTNFFYFDTSSYYLSTEFFSPSFLAAVRLHTAIPNMAAIILTQAPIERWLSLLDTANKPNWFCLDAIIATVGFKTYIYDDRRPSKELLLAYIARKEVTFESVIKKLGEDIALKLLEKEAELRIIPNRPWLAKITTAAHAGHPQANIILVRYLAGFLAKNINRYAIRLDDTQKKIAVDPKIKTNIQTWLANLSREKDVTAILDQLMTPFDGEPYLLHWLVSFSSNEYAILRYTGVPASVSFTGRLFLLLQIRLENNPCPENKKPLKDLLSVRKSLLTTMKDKNTCHHFAQVAHCLPAETVQQVLKLIQTVEADKAMDSESMMLKIDQSKRTPIDYMVQYAPMHVGVMVEVLGSALTGFDAQKWILTLPSETHHAASNARPLWDQFRNSVKENDNTGSLIAGVSATIKDYIEDSKNHDSQETISKNLKAIVQALLELNGNESLADVKTKLNKSAEARKAAHESPMKAFSRSFWRKPSSAPSSASATDSCSPSFIDRNTLEERFFTAINTLLMAAVDVVPVEAGRNQNTSASDQPTTLVPKEKRYGYSFYASLDDDGLGAQSDVPPTDSSSFDQMMREAKKAVAQVDKETRETKPSLRLSAPSPR